MKKVLFVALVALISFMFVACSNDVGLVEKYAWGNRGYVITEVTPWDSPTNRYYKVVAWVGADTSPNKMRFEREAKTVDEGRKLVREAFARYDEGIPRTAQK